MQDMFYKSNIIARTDTLREERAIGAHREDGDLNFLVLFVVLQHHCSHTSSK